MNKKMLLLDRGNDILGLAHEIMFYGYSDMHITTDPYAVYKIAKDYKPDLVILDLAYTKENLDFIWQHFHDNNYLKNIPVVVISGTYNRIVYNDMPQTSQIYIKPVDNIDFASTVGYLMAS